MKSLAEHILGADLRSLAATRIGVASIILADICQRSTDLVAHYSDFGLAPRPFVIHQMSGRWFASFHFLSGVWQVQAFLFLIAAIFALALLVGYRTRIATIGCLVFAVSLNVRNPYVLAGGDALLSAVLFWSIFLPLGARFSVDRAWSTAKSEVPDRVLSCATVAYAVQIVALYWVSVIGKSGVEWRDGSAGYFALSIDYLTTPFGHWLLQLPASVLRFATWSVFFYEAIGPLLLFSPWYSGPVRTLAVFGFVAIHLCFLSTLLIGIFPFIGIVSILFFLPSSFWDCLLSRTLTRDSELIAIYYDADSSFCWRAIQLLKTLLLSRELQTLPAQSCADIEALMREHNSWVVVDRTDRQFLGYPGCVEVIRSTRFLAFLAPMLNRAWAHRIGGQVYRYLAEHRSVICTSADGGADHSRQNLRLSIFGNMVVAFFAFYVVIWNIANLPKPPFKLSDRGRSVIEFVGLDQYWDMFAPFPAKDDGWYVIPGILRDGRLVDLFRDGAVVDWRKPKYISLMVKNHRWRKLMELVRKRPALAASYAGYLCRDWNRRHPASESLQELEIIYMIEWTQRNFEFFEPRKLSFGKFRCDTAAAKS